MELKNILLIAITILLLVVVFNYIFKDRNTIVASLASGKVMREVSASSLEEAGAGNTSNFTYSIWFYIDDWNYRYGEPKVLFGRMMSGTSDKPCPTVTFGAMQNDLSISLLVYPGADSATSVMPNDMVHTCNVPNIPIQKWANLLISAYGRTLDVYLDGKLVRTCVLPGVSKIDANAPVYITPSGGFSGWTSRFQYWADSTDPQTAWNIYRKGYGGRSMLSNTLPILSGSGPGSPGRYGLKVSVTKGDEEYSSFGI
jgi:hypothetical protein